MFQIVITGRGASQKLHAQTLDGRRLCRCKYKTVVSSFPSARLGTGHGCDDSARATQTLPMVRERGSAGYDINVTGLRCTLIAHNREGLEDLMRRLGFGAWRTPPHPFRRVRTIAQIEDERSRTQATMARFKYHGD